MITLHGCVATVPARSRHGVLTEGRSAPNFLDSSREWAYCVVASDASPMLLHAAARHGFREDTAAVSHYCVPLSSGTILLVADLSSAPTRTTTHTALAAAATGSGEPEPGLERVACSPPTSRVGCRFRVATRIFTKFVNSRRRAREQPAAIDSR